MEHYWDTYVRHRYLGDVGPVFGAADARNWKGFEPLRLPTCEGIWRELGKILGRTPPEEVANLLREPLVTWAVEKPLTLPWLFCERVRSGELRPFIYDRVVDPKVGAYPTAVVSTAVNEEKTHPQMNPDPTVSKSLVRPSEARRLAFFSSELNDTDSTPASWNYLTYFVCPDFTKVALHGKDVFYHLDALGPFVAAATAVAVKFMAQLAGAYTDGTLQGMRDVRRFWNLDTGLGLRVQSVATDTAKDVVTRIDLVHVFDVLGHSVEYLREVPWMPRFQAATYGFPEERAFRFRANQQEFESLAELSEPDEEAYLECIRLTDQARMSQLFPAPVGEDEFWQARTAGHACVVQVPTSQLTSGQPVTVALLDIAHRLTLQFRSSIADLGRATSGDDRTAREKLSLFAMADKAQGIEDACTDTVHDWAKKHCVKEKGVVLDFAETPDEVRNGLQFFSTRVLLGFETDPELKRVTALGTWNNVVAKHEVGRNIAMATGRRFVLHPTVAPSEIPTQGGKSTGEPFDPERQYEYYSDASPTEQVFFTVYPLVSTRDGVYDVFAKKKVEEKQFEQLKAIDSVGFVKIVLMYALTGRGALQLDRCWIDGVPVTVERVAPTPV